MVVLNKNIVGLKKAILIALASICLSFIFAKNSEANNNIDYTYQSKEIYTSTYYSKNSIVAAAAEKKNAVCNLEEMRKSYQSSCYSCIVVKTLTEAFMKGAAKVYPVSRDAGSKIAIIGAMIWMVIFAMKNVSSFTSLEPSNNINDILVFLFKVFVAIVFINTGIGMLVKYIVEPILMAGADYGMGIIITNTGFSDPTPEYNYDGVELISTESINKLFGLNQAIDKVVSENLVIGNALICHSMNAGAWVDASLWVVTLKIPSFWIMLCGAAIWVAGFMLTLSISFYVLDVSFKLGFAIMLLPVAIGLWPFEATKKKLSDILSIIFKSTAIFAFLAITTSYSLNMISAAMGGVEEMYDRIENDDATWISERFEITGSFFILIIFAYLYSLKMIGGTINNYVNKFFKDSVFGDSSPIHSKATQATDIAKQKSVGLAKGAAKLGGKAAVAGARGLIRGAKDGETGGTTIVGNARKAVGRFAQFAGKKASQAGDLNRKLSQNLQKFSDKQVAKGVGKKNIFNLAAGGLAGKMAIANANIPGVAKASGVSSTLGAKLQKWGAKEEQKGKDFNAKYRGVKTSVKNTVNNEIDLAKGAAKQGATYVKKMGKDAAESIKEDLRDVGNVVKQDLNTVAYMVKDTKVYQAAAIGVMTIENAANRTGTALSNGYVVATTATKGAVVGAALKTAQTATNIGNKAINAGKRTAVYKGGKYVINKTVQGATYVGNKTVEGAQIVKGATVDTVQMAKDAIVESKVYKTGENVVDGAKTVDRGIRDAAISTRSAVGGVVGGVTGATRDFAQGVKDRVRGAAKDAGIVVNSAIYKGLGGEKLAEKLTGVSRTVASNEAPRSQEQETKKENTYSREDAIRRELEKVKIDYSAMVEKGRKSRDFSWEKGLVATQEAKKYDSLAKNAASEEERVKLKTLADKYKEVAKKAALAAEMTNIKLGLLHEAEHKKEIDGKLHAKIIAGNAFRNNLSKEEKNIYDTSYDSAHKHMSNEWNETNLRNHAKDTIESIRRAERFGVSDAVIEGQGYSYTTDRYGHFTHIINNGYSYVSPDALNEADRRLYDSIAEQNKGTNNENFVDNDFLAAKHKDITDKMHEDHMRQWDKDRGISDSERDDLTFREKEDLTLEKIKEEAELNYENAARRADDVERKMILDSAERNAKKEIEKEAERQRNEVYEKAKESVIKREEEMVRAEAERAKEHEQKKQQETEKSQEEDKNKERKEKERAEKEQTVETENKKQRDEEKKREIEREERRKKDKEEQLKSEKDRKETDEKRKAEDEKRKEEEDDRRNQEESNRTNFKNEYEDLLKKYNITGESSLGNLSEEQRQSLRSGIQGLKSKYKQ